MLLKDNMLQPDYYELCLDNARNELQLQIQALIKYCAETTESNQAEATFVAASKIELLVHNLEQASSRG